MLIRLAAFWLASSASAAVVRVAPLEVRLQAPSAPDMPALPVSDPVLAAFHSGDQRVYLEAARAADYIPPRDDDQQVRLYEEGLERRAADEYVARHGFSKPPEGESLEEKPRRQTKIDYAEFGKRVGRLRALSLDIFTQVETKRNILEASGYTHLRGRDGERIPIAEAAPARVGQVFLHTLQAYRRTIQ